MVERVRLLLVEDDRVMRRATARAIRSKGFAVEENIIYDTTGKAIRFNQNKTSSHTWRDNTFDVTPDEPGFPHKIAEKAGVEPSFRKK